MSVTKQLEALESQSLLGPGWQTVATALDPLRGELHEAEPQTILRVILLDAALRIASPKEDALAFLSNAERWARGQSLDLGAVQLCLMWCQEVGRVDPGAVPGSVLDKAVAAAQDCGHLEAEWRHALAIGSPDNIRLMMEALDHLKAPAEAHIRFQLLLDLATARMDGGDTPTALGHLEEALALSTKHEADLETLQVAAMLAQLRLVQGMQEHARPHLERALSLAIELEIPLAILTAACLLAGLQLCGGEWDAAEATAAIQIPAARKRGNWMAVADGAITQSTCALQRGEHSRAVEVLVNCDMEMDGVAPRAARNLARARLAELRFSLGSEVFDPLLQAAKSTL